MTENLLFEFALKSTAIWCSTWIAMLSWKSASAAVRHFAWAAAFVVSMVLLPAIVFGPVWHVVPSHETTTAAPAAPASLSSSDVPASAVLPGIEPDIENVNAGTADPTPGVSIGMERVILYIWAAGAVIVMFRLALGLMWASRMARQATSITNPEWRRILAESSAAIGVRRAVPILQCEGAAVASTVGMLRPRILIPGDALSWTPERIRLVLLHELAHVKRNDCAVQVLTRISLALQWFQPLAYGATARMMAAQEQACDDRVLSAGADAETYAETLVALARAYRSSMFSKWGALSVVDPSHFRERVAAIVDEKRHRYLPNHFQYTCAMLTGAGLTVILGATGMAARISPVVSETPRSSVSTASAPAQVSTESARPVPVVRPASAVRTAQQPRASSPPSVAVPEPLRFEAASVLPDPPGNPMQGTSGCHGSDNTNVSASIPLGRCVFRGVPMKRLILVAFPPPEKLATSDNVTDGTQQQIFSDVSARGRIMPQDDWVTGGPGWFNSDTFTIEAKAENPETTTQGQLRQMLQTLVKERFKLSYHLEPKVVSGYFIVAAKDGIKLKEVPFRSGPTGPEVRKLRDSGTPLFVMQTGSLIQLAILLTGRFKMPVIDTINSGPVPTWYDFSPLNGVAVGDSASEPADAVGSIFTALPERAGLKLEPAKIPVQVFVIDHAEKPAQN